MIHHVEGNRRYYDLTERLLPPNTDVETPSREEYERFMIQKYMRAGVKHVYYVLEENSSLLENSDTSVSEKVHFVAPLDNLLWNRRMISEIFDFSYSWEVYKPPEKRI